MFIIESVWPAELCTTPKDIIAQALSLQGWKHAGRLPKEVTLWSQAKSQHRALDSMRFGPYIRRLRAEARAFRANFNAGLDACIHPPNNDGPDLVPAKSPTMTPGARVRERLARASSTPERFELAVPTDGASPPVSPWSAPSAASGPLPTSLELTAWQEELRSPLGMDKALLPSTAAPGSSLSQPWVTDEGSFRPEGFQSRDASVSSTTHVDNASHPAIHPIQASNNLFLSVSSENGSGRDPSGRIEKDLHSWVSSQEVAPPPSPVSPLPDSVRPLRHSRPSTQTTFVADRAALTSGAAVSAREPRGLGQGWARDRRRITSSRAHRRREVAERRALLRTVFHVWREWAVLNHTRRRGLKATLPTAGAAPFVYHLATLHRAHAYLSTLKATLSAQRWIQNPAT